MTSLFAGTPAGEAQAQALVSTPDPTQDCPVADIRSGASTLPFNASQDASPNTLRYQATIARLARECTVRGSSMTIKLGVQGRVVVGPVGGPGQIEVPLRYALVQEGPEPKTIVTKLYKFPVTIAEGQSNVPFVHIEEDITFNVPSRAALENYVVYVGFDAAAAKEQPARKTGRKTADPKLRGSH
ncbi:MAG TPA: hypothetical protein VKE26_07435 [Xanthobacteraceae bacterium]|nr:hypothetical protein [Xanthobacteraceae bacterium]